VLAVSRSSDLTALEAEVRDLRECLLAAEVTRAEEIAAAHPLHRRSAANLVHYVELRNHDIRDLQTRLALVGLSSLGRSEPYVLATIEAVLSVLAVMTDRAPPEPHARIALTEGHELLAANAELLLGPVRSERSTRIMVTMPREAADDEWLVDRWIAGGMDLARVNCAHDDREVWTRMIARLRSTIGSDESRCLVAMDLGGPKLRTGPLVAGPRVARIRPQRSQSGRVVAPALIRLQHDGEPSSLPLGSHGPFTNVPVDNPAWLHRRQPGDRIELLDSRGARRHWDVIDVDESGCTASSTQTTYVVTGLELACKTTDGHDLVIVGELPETEQVHRVHHGDRVILTRSLDPVAPQPRCEGSSHRVHTPRGLP
jgi:pyruvate kinase